LPALAPGLGGQREENIHQCEELDDRLLLHLPLHGPWPLSPHDPDSVPGGDVVVVDQVAGAHHTGPTAAFSTMDTNSLRTKFLI